MPYSEIKKISIVIPVYNEEENMRSLYDELKAVLEQINKDYEIIFVDDCSQDKSLAILKDIFQQDEHVQIISLLGNEGQTTALLAGFKQAVGEIILAMDGDGQHDPKYIPQFVAAIEEGNDIASGWKHKDTDQRFKSFLSRIAHKIIGQLVGVKMKYFGATMKAYRREILKNLDMSGNLHRFAGALVAYKGIKIKEVPIKIRPRKGGKSNYGFNKILKVALDLILIKFLTKYAKTPFRMFASLGVFAIMVGLLGISWVAFDKYILGVSAFYNTATIIVAVAALIIGIQFIFFGLMAEMTSRVYYTSSDRNFYVVKHHLKHHKN